MAEKTKPYFITNEKTAFRESLGDRLPVISQQLDSIRAYQFEMHFEMPAGLVGIPQDKFTLACKQVSQIGFNTEPIKVRRVNDTVYYPGEATPEELTVTFDDLYQPKIASNLWEWFASIYNPVTGKYNGNGGDFKANMARLTSLDAQGQPTQETRVFGLYPTSWKTAEFNYGTNEFHTIEMMFRYDFMEHDDADKLAIPTTRNLD